MRKDSDIDLLLIIDSITKRRLERQKEFIEVEKENSVKRYLYKKKTNFNLVIK